METGSPGEYVAQNVRRLRARRGMTVRDLSARLGEIGRPVLPSGITKIEQGQRRVDVDDLVALALALGVNPNALLLPNGDHLPPFGTVREVGLTSTVRANWFRAWGWAAGDQPLEGAEVRRARLSDQAEWFEETKPHKGSEEIAAELAGLRQLAKADEERMDALIEQAHKTYEQEHGGEH